jgi:TonB-dependent SusC/RagA subfamily outer membrane receptor
VSIVKFWRSRSGAYIQIRGQNSITGSSTQPLFVIDGTPMFNDELGKAVDGVGQSSRLNDINPNDIESVQVLKGASAAALWGYRNGVVLISTKKGKRKNIGRRQFICLFDKVNVEFKLQDKFDKEPMVFGQGNNATYGDKFQERGGSDLLIQVDNNF